MALPAGAGLVDADRRAHAPARAAVGRSLAPELRGRVHARCARTRARKEAHTPERVIALIGNLSRDLLPGAAPRVGGGSYHGARALQRLRVPARIIARCAEQDREELFEAVVGLGTTARFVPGEATASFEFSYEGDRRHMRVAAI